MSKDPLAAKPLRADARRNRAALLDVARAGFAAGESDLRIEEIAQRAGVGIGTVYRHFETRDALIDAVYRREVDAYCAAAEARLASLPGDEALFAFLGGLVDHLAANLALAGSLAAVMASRHGALAYGNERLLGATTTLLAAAVATGRVRPDVRSETLLLTLAGFCAGQVQPGWAEQAHAVVGLVVDGLRYGARPGPDAEGDRGRA